MEKYTKIKDGLIFGKLMEMIEVLVIPEGYQEIQREVFAGFYPNLRKIICPSTLISTGYRGFSCSDATEIILNDGLETINEEAFLNEHKIKEIIVPSSVTSIGENAFRGCYSLEKIIINKEEGSLTGAPWDAPTSTEIIWKTDNQDWDNLL